MHIGYNTFLKKRIINSVWIFVLLLVLVWFMLNSEFYFIFIIKKIAIVILMIFFILWLSNKLFFERLRIFTIISQKVYSIFILSWACQAIVEIIVNRILGFNVYLVMLLMFILGIVGPILIVRIIDKLENNTEVKLLYLIVGGDVNDKRTTCMENKTAWD
jgi:hypothetical protein